MTRMSLFSIACLLGCLLGLGCSPSGPVVVPVTGTVTLDGAPVAGASVMFKPVAGGNAAEGETDAAGKFSLKTQLQTLRDGAVVGDYLVSVNGVRTVGTQATEEGASVEAKAPQLEYFVPVKYAKPESSGLTQTVSKGMPPVELKLSTK